MLDTTETNLKVLTIINADSVLLDLLSNLDIRRETLRDYRYRLASFIVFVSRAEVTLIIMYSLTTKRRSLNKLVASQLRTRC